MKPIIIAEACQNHNGDLNILKDMIYAAKEAGADYIKIQSMLADELTFRERFEQGLTEKGITKVIKRPYRSEYERLKKLDLDDDAHLWFIEECRKVGIKPMTTIFSFSRLDFIASLDWDVVKVASYDCASIPFLKALNSAFKHLYISTGATYDNEIEMLAQILDPASFSLLHCVTIYPTPLDKIHLKRIDWLRRFAKNVGYSDHSLTERDGIKASLSALYYGADVIERHFTVIETDQTKDGPISINKDQLKMIVKFSAFSKEAQKDYIDTYIPEYKQMIGDEHRELTNTEILNRDYYRGRFASRVGDRIRYNWEE